MCFSCSKENLKWQVFLPADPSTLPRSELIQPSSPGVMLKWRSSTAGSCPPSPTCEIWPGTAMFRFSENSGPFAMPSWSREKPSVVIPNGLRANASSVWLVPQTGSTGAIRGSRSLRPASQFCHRGMASLRATCSNHCCSQFLSLNPPQSVWGDAKFLGSSLLLSWSRPQ